MKPAWAVGPGGSCAAFGWLQSGLWWGIWVAQGWASAVNSDHDPKVLQQASTSMFTQQRPRSKNKAAQECKHSIKSLPCHMHCRPTGSQHSHMANSQVGRVLPRDGTRSGWVGACAIFAISLPCTLTHSYVWVLNRSPLDFLRTVTYPDLNEELKK